jgi:hypothetical protein
VGLVNRLRAVPQQFYLLPLFVIATLENLIASTWNVDPYHEGALFPTAVGIAEGLSPFREINQQYGFLGPLLVSFPLRFFGNYLIVERLFGFFLLLIITLLIYINLKMLTSKSVSGFIALIWLTISPVWSWPFESKALSGGYWPNQLGILLVLIAFYLIPKAKFATIFAGFLVLLSSQARTQFIFVWIFMTLAITFKEKEKRLFWAIGSCLAALFVFFYLALNQAVDDWFQQTFKVWTMNPPGVPTINLNFFIFNLVNYFCVCFIGLTLWFSAVLFSRNFRTLGLAALAQSVLVIGYLLVPSKLTFDFKVGNYSIVEVIRYSFRNTLFSFVNLTMVSCAILLCAMYFKYRKNSISRIAAHNPTFIILLSASFGLLSLFHNFNPDYSQMIWPVFALLLITLFPCLKLLKLDFFKDKIFKVFVLGILFASHSTFVYHATSQKYPYQTQMLSGLYGNSQDQVRSLDASFEIVSREVTKGTMLMVCQTGLLSTSDKGFLGSDKWTWNQQPEEMISGRLQNLKIGSSILTCHLNSKDSLRIDYLLRSEQIEVLNENDNFILYRVIKSIP